MLNYHSFHQIRQKINVANNLIHRVKGLTSDSQNQDQVNQTIHEQLNINNYPRTLVNRLLNRYKNTRRPSDPNTTNQSPPNHPPSSTQSPTSRPSASQPPPSRPSASQPPPSRQSASQPPTHRPSASVTPTHQPSVTTAAPNQLPTSSTMQLSSHSNSNQQSATDQNSYPRDSNSSPTSYAQQNNPASSFPIHEAPNTAASATRNNHPRIEDPEEDGHRTNNIQYRSFTYIPGLTEQLTKTISTDYPHIRLANRQNHKIGNLHTKIKDPKNKLDQNNVIYNIPCNDCQKCYIGMTQNKLCTRLTGHKTHVNKLEQYLQYVDNRMQLEELKSKTALIEHCIEHEHRFNFENTKIVDRSPHTNTLAFLEMCHIYNTDNTVNRRVDVSGLNTTYAAILHTIKARTNNPQLPFTPNRTIQNSQDTNHTNSQI
ncbi:circumsporozoite protein-like [Aedes albopictus]|uniref:Helix-turn-helix domain-containing protein n=1 Tax=Aedes albopictus TaxID=7160 RepID=A0ABM2A1E3_AEDAL